MSLPKPWRPYGAKAILRRWRGWIPWDRLSASSAQSAVNGSPAFAWFASGSCRPEFVAIGVHSWATIRSVLPSVILDSTVEAESTRSRSQLRGAEASTVESSLMEIRDQWVAFLDPNLLPTEERASAHESTRICTRESGGRRDGIACPSTSLGTLTHSTPLRVILSLSNG